MLASRPKLANHSVMLDVHHLRKSFAGNTALKDVSFSARPGEIVALVGRNGAGKSTLMRIIAGCLDTDFGTITRPADSMIGYLPEGAPLYNELTPRTLFQFVLGAHGISRADIRKCADHVLQILDLDDVAHQVLGTLSKGYQRRTALGMALAPDPDILILDEPFDGFDPIQKHSAVDLLRALSPDKVILISTHSLSDAQRLANRMIVLENGEVRADATPQILLRDTKETNLDAAFRTLVGSSS